MALRPSMMVAATQNRRTNRVPTHTFNLRTPPYCIQPFMIAPVLAGETLVSASMQVRAVSDTLRNRLLGGHKEYYFFYVKLNDLTDRATLTQMLLDPGQSIAAIDDPTNRPALYHPAGVGMMNYTQMCLTEVVNWYFRDEDDDASNHTVSNGTYTWPLAKINNRNPFDSASGATYEESTAVNPELVVGVDDKITGMEVDNLLQQFLLLQQNGLIQMNYEQYLEQFGVRLREEEPHKPELLRYIKDWTYPTNTVDPVTGVPSTALSWSLQERLSKRRFFTEPGFIFGVTVTRPKVYLSNQQGSFSATMNRVEAWLPPTTASTYRGRRIKLADNVGPFQAGTDANGYYFDMADLLSYGEQFINHPLNGTDVNFLPLPDATLSNIQYPPTWASIRDMFVGTGSQRAMVEEDGAVQLIIASHLGPDKSPRGGPEISGMS